MTTTDALDALIADQHPAVHLVYFEGRTAEEVAVMLTTDRAAVGRALATAFRRIADHVLVG